MTTSAVNDNENEPTPQPPVSSSPPMSPQTKRRTSSVVLTADWLVGVDELRTLDKGSGVLSVEQLLAESPKPVFGKGSKVPIIKIDAPISDLAFFPEIKADGEDNAAVAAAVAESPGNIETKKSATPMATNIKSIASKPPDEPAPPSKDEKKYDDAGTDDDDDFQDDDDDAEPVVIVVEGIPTSSALTAKGGKANFLPNKHSMGTTSRSTSGAGMDDSDNKRSVATSVTSISEDVGFDSIATVASTASVYSENIGAEDIWQDVPMGQPDAILGIAQAYRACTNPNKVNVCVGAYRDENGQPWVLPSVRQAEYRMLEDPTCNKEYLPIEGDKEFIQCAMEFAYGPNMPMEHVAAIQTLSGTGACRIGGLFLSEFYPGRPIYVPEPTWGNHITIMKKCNLNVRKYRYYNKKTNRLNIKGMLKDISRAPKGSVILLHACAHNPTGCDPTIEQWKQIVSLISEKEHVGFFDSAYQGFATGDAEQDAQPFRYAVAQGIPIILAQSFAKNFGLYGERCGTLSIVCGDLEQKTRIISVLKTIVRPMYSSPPKHGSSIVKTILKDEQLTLQYRKECAHMSLRIQKMRSELVAALKKAGSVHDWSHITEQIGMFAFTGMTPDMCEELTQNYFIYLTANGRISVAGLNEKNLEYVANAIHVVTNGKSITTTIM